MRVYLSGPISLGGRLSKEEIDANCAHFHYFAARLRRAGHTVYSPPECERQSSWEGYMRVLLPEVCRADVVGTLPGWLESRGSVLEVFVATQVGVPVQPADELDVVAATPLPASSAAAREEGGAR